MANLVELFDNIVQMQNLNGVPLANGKMYVYALGRTRLMDTWSDADGESLNSNPIILDAAGQCHCYVSDDFDYSLVVTDAYDNEIFSIDKYLYSEGSHSHADVAVAPSETIAVSSYHVGETTVYVPYLTGQLGKVYEGIEPIVVNNTEDKISANHVPLGVQDPLYFVQDDEEGCIIGFSGQTIPEGVMSESSLGFENNKITGYNGSAFSAGNEYEAGSYVDITDNTISVTGLQPEGDYAYNSALSSKLDVTATGQFLTGLPDDLVYTGDMTAYQPAGDYQTAGDYLSASDSGKFYPMEGNPSGFLTEHQSLAGYATEQWVEDKGYLTGVDIPESANWNEATTVVNNNSAIWNNTTNIVSSKSAQWGAANPQIPVTGINGIKISESGDQVVFEVSGDYATNAQLADKLDTTALNSNVDSITISYSAKPTDNPIYASGNDLKNVNSIQGRSDLAIVPNGVLQVPNVITAVPGFLQVPNSITATNGNLTVQNAISAASNNILNVSGIITANQGGIAANGLSANSVYGLTANGLTADAAHSSFSAIGISAGKRGPLCIEGQAETIFATGGSGFTFSSQNTAFGTAALTTAYSNNLVKVTAPKFEARNISGAGFTIEASGAKGYDESGNVVWDTQNPQIKNIISYGDTKTAQGGLNGNIILTVMPSTNASNLTSAPYVIMDASNASYFAAYGPSAQAPTVSMKPSQITFELQAGNTGRTTVGYNDVKQELGGSSWTLTGSIQKRELEYDANTSAITAIAGSAIGGNGGGDVPEGVMAESGLEYNAVNEISGYNGSAIAQYGAEKQWLVVDDTLLTLSNSAQFALGVNISAVQQLMGIDETELLSSTATSAFTLTEPLTGFKAVKIKLRWWDKVPDNYYDVERFNTGKLSLSWTYFDNISDGGPLELAGASWTSNNGINYNLEGSFARTFSVTSTGMGFFTNTTPYPLSIVGVGRIN